MREDNVGGSDESVHHLIITDVCGSVISFRLRSVFHLSGGHQFLVAPNLFPVFTVNIQHTKALPVLLAQMLMVHLMGPADGAYISIPTSGEPLETLMDDHVMHHEIGETIRHDPETDRLHPPDPVLASEHDQQHAGYGKYDKKSVVLLEESGLHLMMIAMQIPEKSMHHPLMCGPGDAFHEDEGQQQYGDEIDNGHNT